MPIPTPNKDEDGKKFISRCMNDEIMKKDYPENQQRIAICLGQTKKSKSSLLNNVLAILGFTYDFDCEDCGNSEELTISNLI